MSIEDDLDLSNQQLSKIPLNPRENPQIFQHLKRLSLAGNQLASSELEVLKDMQSLEELYLNGNKLRYLPSCLFNLKQLKVLSLADNYLSTVTADIQNLDELQHLDLSRNHITSLPVDILVRSLPNLISLNIAGNPVPQTLLNGYAIRLRHKLSIFVTTQPVDFNYCKCTAVISNESLETDNDIETPEDQSQPESKNQKISVENNIPSPPAEQVAPFQFTSTVIRDSIIFDEFDVDALHESAPPPPPSLLPYSYR